MRSHECEILRRRRAAGLYGCMYALRRKRGEQRRERRGLQNGLAAGEGHSPAAVLVVVPVPQDDALYFLRRHQLAAEAERPSRADRGARAAGAAARPVHTRHLPRRPAHGAVWAGAGAHATGGTFFLIPQKLPRRALGLRIGAPWTVQAAALQKNHRAYARPVVHGEALDLKDP